MNKMITCFVACSLFFQTGMAQENGKTPKTWNVVNMGEIHLPALSQQGDVNFKKTELTDYLSTSKTEYDVLAKKATLSWEKSSENDLSNKLNNNHHLYLLETNIHADQWSKSTLELTTNNPMKVYMDKEVIKEYNDTAKTTLKIPVELSLGSHHLTIAYTNLQENPSFKSSIKIKENELSCSPSNTSHKRILSLNDLLNGTKISSSTISPSGNFYTIVYKDIVDGKGLFRYQIRKMKDHQIVEEWRYSKLINWRWTKNHDKVVYALKSGTGYEVLSFDANTQKKEVLYSGIEKLSSFYITPDETKILYYQQTNKSKKEDLKRIYTPDDRIDGYRDRYSLRMVNLNTQQDLQLTTGYLTTSLEDISPKSDKILFSTKQQDCQAWPFYRMKIYEMDLNTFKVDTLFNKQDDSFSVSYSPDASKLVYQATPISFKGIGKNIQTDHKANTFDSQIFIYDRKTKAIEAITKDFDPSISSFEWAGNNTIYFLCSERDYKTIYRYDLTKKTFTKLQTPVDVIYRFTVDNVRHQKILYYGSSIDKDTEVYCYNTKKKNNLLIAQSDNVKDSHLKIGKTEEFNFTNHNEDTIYGRVYYPPNYKEGMKYPVIVYYYGGTSPTVRSFGGRYPKNLWAARGYIVYVLQPSGATGFGQNFSSYHVNGWGKDAIDDIIQGTKEFLKAHPSADKENVGCIGASYGGFTTMMLQTRTDIFKTAISHAGISDITSYWGEGYWGYSYNTIAATGSYPWNNTDLFVKQSPLFRADKFQNSILLLHGTADTNVPVGESKQYYMALKLLKKDAEMVLVDGENHWIVDYKKRIQWHKTIVSWFDYRLKNQPEQWESLYPKKQF